MKKTIITTLLSITAAFVFAVVAQAATSTMIVTGDTAAGENQPGWMFNRDVRTSTPFEFNTDEASIGYGSLYVHPITNTNTSGLAPNDNWDKFIAENFLAAPVADVDSISYDFMIGDGFETKEEHFYLNVYANIDDSDNFYDCRFDYVPTVGSSTEFTTFTVEATDTPTAVTKRGTRIAACPATLAEMPEGSYIRAFAINVGDTSANDMGLHGYLDNVVVVMGDDATVYDFEPALTPVSKDECKNGGWMTFNTPTFGNQGQCVSYVQANEKAGKR